MAKIRNMVTVHSGEMLSKMKTPDVCVGMQVCTNSFEINMTFSQNIENQSTSRYICTNLGLLPKEFSSYHKRNFLNYIYKSTHFKSQNLKKKLDAPQLKKGQ